MASFRHLLLSPTVSVLSEHRDANMTLYKDLGRCYSSELEQCLQTLFYIVVEPQLSSVQLGQMVANGSSEEIPQEIYSIGKDRH